MITALTIFNDVRSFLDDDKSLRYNETDDLVPALNKAVLYLTTIFNSAFEQKKLSPEVLSELVYTAILPVTGTTTKKANVTTLMTTLWTILGVSPDPIVTGSYPNELLNETRNRWAARASLESWDDASSDPFSPGTDIPILPDFAKPSYIGPGHYGGDASLYIMIRPGSVFTVDKVAIFYLKNPTTVLTSASTIEFPLRLHNLLVDKTINYISIQQGPESQYGKVTDKEVSTLVSLMIS